MSDAEKSREELLKELRWLRERNAMLESLSTISEAGEDEQRLRAMFFTQAIETMPLIFFRLDAHGLFLESLGAGLERLGVQPNEVVGRSALEIVPDARPSLERALRGETVRYEAEGETNGKRWVFLSLATPDQVSGRGVLGLGIDITERRESEQALQGSEALRRAVLEHSSDYIVIITREGRIDYINRDVDARPRQQVIGAHISEYMPTRSVETFQSALEEVFAGTDEARFEIQSVNREGRPTWFQVVLSPIYSEDRVVAAAAIGRDVTEIRAARRKELQLRAQMEHAQKLESLGVLAGGIAHDFNNLLTGVLGNASLALMSLPPSAPGRSELEAIEAASQRAADLCRQMLAYAGKGRFVVRPLDLSELVRDMVSLLRVSISKRATLKLDCAEGMPAVEGDATQLHQVLMNLVINASDAFGDQDGVITVATGVMECDPAYLQGTFVDDELPAGTFAFLEVSDNGRGMDAATKSKIFDPFFSTKRLGRGLGMAAVLGIVRGHRGAIKVYSEVGKGTSVKVLFPASDRDAEALGPRASEIGKTGGGTILVVDDERVVRRMAKAMLERNGYSVVIAENGTEALQRFKQDPFGIDAVLLDLTMPGMSGEQVFREMRRIHPDVSVVLTSGYSEQDVTDRFAGKRLAGFLQKPYRAHRLAEVIARAVRERGNSTAVK